jgi:alpha-glucosidase (family GH31 glycosyl hydrolase)
MSLNATHPSNGFSQYNTHSLFGLMESTVTNNFLAYDESSPHYNKRQYILSRSTFAGSGAYATHWLGDNHREWKYMKYSIAGMMNF